MSCILMSDLGPHHKIEFLIGVQGSVESGASREVKEARVRKTSKET